MLKNGPMLALVLVVAACAGPSLNLAPTTLGDGVALRGVNLSGAEFGEQNVSADSSGLHGKDYIYPVPEFIEGYETPVNLVAAGFNTFRLPFLWERLQPELGEPLDDAELTRLSTAVAYLNDLGAFVIIDPHNYARYRGQVIGSGVSAADFADFWRRLAEEFKTQRGVAFGLMNEPNNMRTLDWVDAANAAIGAIRAVEAPNLILVPGNHWTGAHSWNRRQGGPSNARAMLAIEDPLGFVAFEAHQYANRDSSGSTPDCVAPASAAKRLAPFTRWLRTHGKIGFLGEFGGGPNPNCFAAVDAMLTHIEDNADVYIGWTSWAAGPWWPDGYHLSLEPDGAGRPQLDVLSGFLLGPDGSPLAAPDKLAF